jgi:hypothetical protein
VAGVIGDPLPPRLGCSLVAHRDLGFCAGCRGYDTSQELIAWRILAMRERGIPLQPWEVGVDDSA